MSRAIVFDLNGTLLDLSALDPEFQRVFGKPEMRKTWFNHLLVLFLTATVIDEYQNFDTLSSAALDMVARAHHVDFSGADLREVAEQIVKTDVYGRGQPRGGSGSNRRSPSRTFEPPRTLRRSRAGTA